MKKIFSFFVAVMATMMLFAQDSFKVTWVTNGVEMPATPTSNEDLWKAFMPAYNAFYGLSRAEQPITAVTTFAPAKMQEFVTDENSDWKWLGDYILAVVKTANFNNGDLTSEVLWRFNVQAFFNCKEAVSSTWNGHPDFTEAGKFDSWIDTWKKANLLPETMTAEDAMPTLKKPEYIFIGWFDNEACTGSPVQKVTKDITLYAKWERAVYNVSFVAPFAYPNPLFSSDKDMMYAELNADYNTFYNQTSDWGVLSTFTAITDGMPSKGGRLDLTFFANEAMKAKWGWLLEYCDTICARQKVDADGKDLVLPSTNASYARYNVNAFFMNSIRASWPVSANYAECGVDAKNQEWKKFWGYELALPDTIAEDYTLPVMYRENYEFKGWYWNTDFTDGPVTVVPVKSNGTLYAKFEATDKALLGIALDKKDTVELQMPNTDQLTVIFTPETAANKKVVWSSSNEEVLVVDQNGLVTPKAPGLATVKVVSDESKLVASVVYNISAAPGAVTGVTLDQTAVTLEMGKTIQLVATIAPEDATNKKVTWTSSSKAASVDENGLVKADTVGTATITVTTEDGGYTATCIVTVPEPLDDILVEKLWEVAIPTAVANIGDVRNGMGYNGKFYLTDKNQNKLRVFTKEGEDVDAAIAMPEGAKLGTGIAIDDAGNILLAANFPGNDTCVFIVKNGEKTMKKVDFNLPMPGRADQFTAFGDVSSEQGGLVFFHGTGATKIQYVKIANDTLVEVKQMEPVVKTGSSTANVLYGTETEAWLNVRGQGMQYVKNGVVTDVAPKNVVTNDCGGAIMFIGENEVWAYKVGTVHSSEFSVRNMTTQQFVADKDGNTVQYIIDKTAAANNSYANFTKAEKINDYAYYLNVFTSGKGAAVYKVYKDVPATAIALDKTAETVKAGDKLQLTATITPSYATIQEVVWSTSDSAIAIVDQTGLVQAVGAGEATITVATTDGTNLTATCALTVEPVLYRKVMSVQELEAGKKMLITNGDSLTVAEPRKNNFGAVAVTVEDGVISNVPAEATVITLEKDSVFSFAIDGGYITATTAASNYLRVAAERSSLTGWDITIADNGTAVIVCHDKDATRGIIRYNAANNLFSAYAASTSVKDSVNIYIEFEPVTYNVTVPEGTPACYIAGEMNSWTFTEMTMVDATHYTITLNYATKAHKYKYTCGPDWKYVEKNADGTERADRTWTEADVVEKWAEIEDAVDNIQIDNISIQKMMIDGHLYIIREGKMYNANGTLVR